MDEFTDHAEAHAEYGRDEAGLEIDQGDCIEQCMVVDEFTDAKVKMREMLDALRLADAELDWAHSEMKGRPPDHWNEAREAVKAAMDAKVDLPEEIGRLRAEVEELKREPSPVELRGVLRMLGFVKDYAARLTPGNAVHHGRAIQSFNRRAMDRLSKAHGEACDSLRASAEAAEAEVKRLREALERIAIYHGKPEGNWTERTARAALENFR